MKRSADSIEAPGLRSPAVAGRRKKVARAPADTVTAIGVALCASALAACQSTAPAPDAPAPQAAHALARTIGDAIGRCWFGPGETGFAGYIYSPEPNGVVPRILIVRQDAPAERPVLVVEATGAASVTTYGPLLDGGNRGRIEADLDRWAKGGTGCS